MKRVRCPKCDSYITFDETQYADGQRLVFECPDCRKQFSIRIGVGRLLATRKEAAQSNDAPGECGAIVVIENVFHYRQVIPLVMGDNVIGRYVHDTSRNTPIETEAHNEDPMPCR